MNMISFSMITADSNGSVLLASGTSNFKNFTSRVSRQATLDGGCVISHSGVSDSDRVFNIETIITEEQETAIDYIYRNSALIFISCSEGLFLGTISTKNLVGSKLTMTVLIKSKEA